MVLGYARLWADSPVVRQVLTLTRAGVPFDVAVSWDDDERLGWYIAACKLDGHEFDWSTGRWKQPNE